MDHLTEYPPLFNPGFHRLSIEQLDKTFVSPFTPSDRRRYLSERFNALIERFRETGLSAEVWIDGSYATEKPEPEDIDVVFFVDEIEADELSWKSKSILDELKNRRLSKIRYQCDVFMALKQDVHMRIYWEGWFGRSREKIPKGIPRLYI